MSRASDPVVPAVAGTPPAAPAAAHVVPDRDAWAAAGPPLVRRALAELAYEGLLRPEPDGASSPAGARGADPTDAYRVGLPAATWRFRAARGTFDTWRIVPGSVTREAVPGAAEADATAVPKATGVTGAADGPGASGHQAAAPAPLPRRTGTAEDPAADPVALLLDAAPVLGLAGGGLVDAVRDLQATRAADAHAATVRPDAATLADLSHVALEAHGDGHPCMVLNKGRLGFGPAALRAYAPEHAPDVRLVWLAVHPGRGVHHGEDDLDARGLREHQLDPDERAAFAARLDAVLAETGRPDDPPAGAWAWVPVHPFHLEHVVAPLFAGDLAAGRLVVLGEGRDRHRPLQSVRTLANVDRPDRHDVKLPLAIRNTLVWRGISPEHSAQAPRLSAWLAAETAADPLLRDSGFVALGEVAAVTVEHPALGRVPDLPYRWSEAGGAVFRTPVAAVLRDGERARSMAALTLVGRDGRALVAELVDRSGLSAEAWVARFLDALLPPLAHWLVRHGVAFCPHGENTVVLFDAADVPVRVAVKDLAEDVNLVPEHRPEHDGLHPDAAAVLLRWPVSDLRHALLSAVFAGHFRTFAPLLEEHGLLAEDRFWALVAGTLERTRRDDDPALREAFDAIGLFDATFERICLNREQLSGDDFHERAERDEGFDLHDGVVRNPLAGVDRAAAEEDVDALLGGAPGGRASHAAAAGTAAPVGVVR